MTSESPDPIVGELWFSNSFDLRILLYVFLFLSSINQDVINIDHKVYGIFLWLYVWTFLFLVGTSISTFFVSRDFHQDFTMTELDDFFG